MFTFSALVALVPMTKMEAGSTWSTNLSTDRKHESSTSSQYALSRGTWLR